MSEQRTVRSRGWCITRAIRGSLDRAGVCGRGAVDVPVAGVRAWGATSPLNKVTVHLGGVRLGLVGADAMGSLVAGAVGVQTMGAGGVRTSCGGVVGRKSLALGTGPINESVSMAQSSTMDW
jgi:hypothetical protein